MDHFLHCEKTVNLTKPKIISLGELTTPELVIQDGQMLRKICIPFKKPTTLNLYLNHHVYTLKFCQNVLACFVKDIRANVFK